MKATNDMPKAFWKTTEQPEEISDQDKFLLQLNGPKGRARTIRKLAEQERKFTAAIAWVITDGLDGQIPEEFSKMDLGEHSYIILDGECDRSYYGLHEVEMNPHRLVYPPKTLRCRFCEGEVDITNDNTWRFPYTP